MNLAFSRKARPEGFTIRCPVWPRTFRLVGQFGPKTLPPGEPFRPRGLSDSRAHDPEGSDRAIHVPLKRLWLQSQNLPAMQIPVDNDSSHPQFSTGFPQGLFAWRRQLQAINERGSPDGRAAALSEKTRKGLRRLRLGVSGLSRSIPQNFLQNIVVHFDALVVPRNAPGGPQHYPYGDRQVTPR